VRIPVIANGDINSPEKARYVQEVTKADGLMIGRAAQGRPWIFREINHYLANNTLLPPPSLSEVRTILLEHLTNLYAFYGEYTGVRMARKHLSWYSKGQTQGAAFRRSVNQAESSAEQMRQVEAFFAHLHTQEIR
jgi:tRNA-dihydrouridine synthase B